LLKVSHSQLGTYNTCQQKWAWIYDRHLVPIDEVQYDLFFGIGIHEGLESLYLGDSLEASIARFIKTYAPYEGQAPKYKNKTIAKGTDLLTKYPERFFPEAFKVLEVEKRFEFSLTEDVDFVVVLDLIIETERGIELLDHKTSGNLNWFTIKPNHQFTSYMQGAKQKLGLDMRSVIANVLLTCRKSTNVAKDFFRQRATYDEADFAEWKLWAMDTTDRLKKSIKTGCYVKNDKACWNCPFKILCSAANEGAQDILAERMFRDNGRS
jgi:hypothetical protein